MTDCVDEASVRQILTLTLTLTPTLTPTLTRREEPLQEEGGRRAGARRRHGAGHHAVGPGLSIK